MSERRITILEGGVHQKEVDGSIYVGNEWLTAAQWLQSLLSGYTGRNVRVSVEEMPREERSRSERGDQP